MKKTVVGILCILAFGAIVNAQDKPKPASPKAQAQCKLADGKTITVDYSSPRMKGRKIFGGLVPYNDVWRTGANEATTFVTSADLSVGGTAVPAGSYTLFTVPSEDKWILIISKVTGEWGIPYKDDYKSQELARVPMTVSKTPAPVENMTIGFDQSGGCTLQVSWENIQASVKFSEK